MAPVKEVKERTRQEIEAGLAQEQANGKRTAICALLAAAIGLFAGFYGGIGIVGAIVFDKYPNNSPERVLFLNERSTELTLIGLASAIASLLLIPVLVYLYRAVKLRRPQLPTVAIFCAVAGPVLLAIGGFAYQIAIGVAANDFATTGNQTYNEAKAAFESSGITVSQIVLQAGVIALGFAFVLIGLNSMRTGLITRFMGVLAIISGVLFVLPIGSPAPVIQCFWLGAMGYLFLGRWPNGVPPAWRTGKAEQWPTRQQMVEQAAKKRAEQAGLSTDDSPSSGNGSATPPQRKGLLSQLFSPPTTAEGDQDVVEGTATDAGSDEDADSGDSGDEKSHHPVSERKRKRNRSRRR